MKFCIHVYSVMNQPLCPECGNPTHETDFQQQVRLHKKWIEDGKHLEMQCPMGGTIRGWWDI